MRADGKPNGRAAVYTVVRTENLGVALAAFRDQFDADPAGVVVNPGLVEQTAAAAVGAGLDIPVASSGGVLLGEIWLQRPAADPVSAVDAEAGAAALRSLTARVAEARRAAEPMTPERARQMVMSLEMEHV